MAPSTTGHNLIMVLTAMRNFGIGANVRRTVWKNPGCYWTVTRYGIATCCTFCCSCCCLLVLLGRLKVTGSKLGSVGRNMYFFCMFPTCSVKQNPDAPYKRGKVWGQYYWNGRAIGKETSIGGVAKKQWLLDAEQTLPPDALRSVLPPAHAKKAIEDVKSQAVQA